MAKTVQDGLNDANPNILPSYLQEVPIGDFIAGLTGMMPQKRALTGLDSLTVHVHDKRGLITAVYVGGNPVTIIPGGETPAAGQVAIDYDETGLGTLTFQAANTAYTVTQLGIPASLNTILSRELGA